MSSEQPTFYCAEHDRSFKNKGAMLSHYKLAKHKVIPPDIVAELGLPTAPPANPGATTEEVDELRQALQEQERRLGELSGANEAILGRLDGHGQVLAATNEELNSLNSTIRSVLAALGIGGASAPESGEGGGGNEGQGGGGNEGQGGGGGAQGASERQAQLYAWGDLIIRGLEAAGKAGLSAGGGGGGGVSPEDTFGAVINAMGNILKQFGSLRGMFLDELRTVYRVSPEAAKAVLEPPPEEVIRHIKRTSAEE